MRYTRTFVSYCSDDSPGMPELAEAYRKIEVDFLERSPHLEARARSEFQRRVELLRLAWAGLLERVPE